MTRQELMDDFAEVLSSVRSRTYPYKARPKQKRNWTLYDEAQEHEYPDVLIRDVVNEAANSYRLVRHDATGKSGYSADDIAKMRSSTREGLTGLPWATSAWLEDTLGSAIT